MKRLVILCAAIATAMSATAAEPLKLNKDNIDEIIKTLEGGGTIAEKTIIMDEKGFDASTITQEDVDAYGI